MTHDDRDHHASDDDPDLDDGWTPWTPWLDEDGLPHVYPGGRLAGGLPHGTVVDHWQCPSCDRTVDITYRPGRPRLYCSHACRQRAYRWRRRNNAHTVATSTHPTEQAVAYSHERGLHALRTAPDPLAHRRDRRAREVTVCGLLARPGRLRPHRRNQPVPYQTTSTSGCTTCNTLIQPRPHGLVQPILGDDRL